MGPVEFNQVVRIAHDERWIRGKSIEPAARTDRLDPEQTAVTLDVHAFAGRENLIEDRVDIGAEMGRSDSHAINLRSIRTYASARTYCGVTPLLMRIRLADDPLPRHHAVINAQEKGPSIARRAVS